jgi:hypothetical protein
MLISRPLQLQNCKDGQIRHSQAWTSFLLGPIRIDWKRSRPSLWNFVRLMMGRGFTLAFFESPLSSLLFQFVLHLFSNSLLAWFVFSPSFLSLLALPCAVYIIKLHSQQYHDGEWGGENLLLYGLWVIRNMLGTRTNANEFTHEALSFPYFHSTLLMPSTVIPWLAGFGSYGSHSRALCRSHHTVDATRARRIVR